MPDRDVQRVLIIDDQQDDIELATAALLECHPDWVVEVARSAEEGLRKADQAGWGLILLDHHLPHKDGLEILPALRRRAPEAGIVMLTAHGDERVAVEAMRSGADYYQPKSSGFLAALPLVAREVLEKCRLRSALARAEGRYRRLIESVTDIVYDLDAEGRFQYVSAAAHETLGYAPEEMVGQPYRRFLHPDDLASCGRQFHERRTGARATRHLAVRLITKAGEAKEFEVSAAGVYDEARRFQATAGLARDVTQRKRAEEALRAAEAQLRQAQKLEAVGRLAGGIAHDFNNLLTPILGYAKRLARRLPEGGDEAREADLIVRAAARAAELTGQLLAFSRHQIGSPRVLDVNRQLRAMESLLRSAIGERIALEVLPGRDLRRVVMDPGQLDQVILNLALNARDAMPQGGTLSLRSDNATEDMTSHPLVTRGRYVRLSVEDTGEGMSEEVLSRIFEPFYTTKAPGQGTGLGLAIVDRIVTQAGGFVEVRSLVGRGTTVQVFLPATEEPARPDEGEDGGQTGRYRGTETILLVDDNRGVRTFLAKALRSLGYTVLEAADGEEAVRLTEHHQGPLDLLLSDVVMPRMSGWELVRTLRRRRAALPVLLISGYPSLEGVERDQGEEGEEIVRKPFASEELAKRIRSLLDRRKRTA
jgi:two-component system cell cycle sensor histidine kinase/response regulator CckA